MRIAWFSPLPPVRSGIAAYSAEVVPLLAGAHAIECFDERSAHDFVWKARRDPFDLVVYQMGNARCHDFMWAYVAAYPGLVVLHDARLHHARGRQLLQGRRFDDYRREFAYGHPGARADFAEYAVEGLGGGIYYFWSMTRPIVRTARGVAVHNARVAADLREECPGAAIDVIRMGVPAIETPADARASTRRALDVPGEAILFAAFGKVTAEKRIGAILRALGALVAAGRPAYLLLVGDAADYAALTGEIDRHHLAGHVRLTGHVTDAAIGAHLAAADACLCLRWPTAQESSASWLRCLAAGRATVLSDLAHLVDIPSADAREPIATDAAPVALRVDLLDEDRALLAAMERLAGDRALRDRIGRAGLAFWRAHHTMDAMVSDYQRVIANTAARSAPVVPDLPAHFTEDYSTHARGIADRFDRDVDILRHRHRGHH